MSGEDCLSYTPDQHLQVGTRMQDILNYLSSLSLQKPEYQWCALFFAELVKQDEGKILPSKLTDLKEDIRK